ncbi:OsmC family protein [Streptomyces violascens]|uniref:OsmC family protein n=1 Tax=Streptomyces violascens TaxID=67381 RepID=UPI001CFCAA0D|nr:OsmC family protein [Streptomyces violascens]
MSVGHARDHSVTIDRPKEKDGTDAGPMGGELLLLSLGGCYLSTFLAALQAEDPEADARDVHVRVEGTLVPAPTRFSEIAVTVSAPAALRDLISKPLLKAERGCIVHNSIRDAIAVHFTHAWF